MDVMVYQVRRGFAPVKIDDTVISFKYLQE